MLLACIVFACSDDEGNGNGNGDGNHLEDADGSGNGDDSGGTDQPRDGNGGPDLPICDEVELKASPVSNLLMVVDKSGSMNDPTSASDPDRTKMDDLRDAVSFVLEQFEGRIRFGWMAFPNQDDCDPGVVSVPVSDDSTEDIRGLVTNSIAWGGTPTGESLQNALDYEGLRDLERSNFVVLVTDGLPTCPNGNGQFVNDADGALALQAVQDLKAVDIDSFIIGLGEDINNSNPQLLSDMAEAGGRPRPGGIKYYQANSLLDLQNAFEEIGKAVFDCSLALEVVPEKPEWIWVYFDGQPVSRDTQNGFDYNGAENMIEFFGQACDRLREGEVLEIEVKMGCRPPD
jgi:hypothetical protein